MANIKFSEFPKATTSKDSDEIAILQDGVNKMIQSPVLESKIINKTVTRVIDQGGASLNVVNLKGVVPTYADLATITPTPEINDAYQVEADGLVYVYTEDGFQADGEGFKVQPEPTGVIEEGNTQAVSGGEVYINSILEWKSTDINLEHPITRVYKGSIYQVIEGAVSTSAAPEGSPTIWRMIGSYEPYSNSLKAISNKENFVGFATNKAAESKILFLNSAISNIRIISNNETDYNYWFSAFYYQSTNFNNGIAISRKHKSSGAIGNFRIDLNNIDLERATQRTFDSLLKFNLNGVQRINIDVIPWALTIEFDLNVDLLEAQANYDNNNGIVDITALNNYNWNLNFSKSVYQKKGADFQEYKTFTEALRFRQNGVFKVGDLLVTSSGNINKYGFGANFKPSYLQQYKSISATSNEVPKTSYSEIDIYVDGIFCYVKWFGKKHIYFGDNTRIFRTKDEFKNKRITVSNTNIEEIVLPATLPDGTIPNNGRVLGIIELDNGEILIECRNGQTVNGKVQEQLYKTVGLTSATTTIVDGITKYDMTATGLVKKVLNYKEGTRTHNKTGTTVSVYGNIVVLSPYGVGATGVVWLSKDYGENWECIFNMQIDDIYTDPKGANGAWPLPQDLDPPMPSDMWTGGGNSNRHVHGVTYDYVFDRIWVATGDATTYFQGRTAIWYTDDFGLTWVRLQTRGEGVMNTPVGLQPMGFFCNEKFVFATSDSAPDGIYRYTRGNKSEVPEFESAYWINDTYTTGMNLIGAGQTTDSAGGVYFLFHTNFPDSIDRAVVIYTPDGITFKKVYENHLPLSEIISWGSFIGNDRFGNVYICVYTENEYTRKVIKLN